MIEKKNYVKTNVSEGRYEIEEKESLGFISKAEEIELIDEEENYAYNIKQISCDVDNIPIEYKREVVEY